MTISYNVAKRTLTQRVLMAGRAGLQSEPFGELMQIESTHNIKYRIGTELCNVVNTHSSSGRLQHMVIVLLLGTDYLSYLHTTR